MSTVAVLPSTLREKLAAASRRVRTLRAIRGLCFLTLTLVFIAAVAVGLDAWLELPANIRSVLFFAWLGAAGTVTVFAVLIPMFRRIDRDAVAAVVEERYTDLSERLTSSVELASGEKEANGSPALIALLIEETSARTRSLDFAATIPAQKTLRLAFMVVAALLASSVAVLLAPHDAAR